MTSASPDEPREALIHSFKVFGSRFEKISRAATAATDNENDPQAGDFDAAWSDARQLFPICNTQFNAILLALRPPAQEAASIAQLMLKLEDGLQKIESIYMILIAGRRPKRIRWVIEEATKHMYSLCEALSTHFETYYREPKRESLLQHMSLVNQSIDKMMSEPKSTEEILKESWKDIIETCSDQMEELDETLEDSEDEELEETKAVRGIILLTRMLLKDIEKRPSNRHLTIENWSQLKDKAEKLIVAQDDVVSYVYETDRSAILRSLGEIQKLVDDMVKIFVGSDDPPTETQAKEEWPWSCVDEVRRIIEKKF